MWSVGLTMWRLWSERFDDDTGRAALRGEQRRLWSVVCVALRTVVAC